MSAGAGAECQLGERRGRVVAEPVTIGIDIGTTSVKAVAADAAGAVVARVRIPHVLRARHAGELAHDARAAWRDGPLAALAEILGDRAMAGRDVLAVQVAAMVPSLCAVDDDGVPLGDGLLYGDARGEGGEPGSNPSESGELVRFLGWLHHTHPDAAGYWPAQAVANAALTKDGFLGGAIDTVTAMTTVPLFDFTGWDATVAAEQGVADIGRLPRIVTGAEAVGRVPDAGGARLGGGTIDAFAEQLVAGADHTGDVLVILGATLIVWAVVDQWRQQDGLWTVPHTVPGKTLTGGASNAGGLFVGWVRAMCGLAPDWSPRESDDSVQPDRVPIWVPHLRGARVPFHDPSRRASLHDLDIGMGRAHVLRGAHEASGFVVADLLERAGVDARRLVVSGGGTRDRGWVQALADASGLEAHVVDSPEGGALGAAHLARAVAGLHEPPPSAWVRTGDVLAPDPVWVEPTAGRFRAWQALDVT